MMEFLGVFIFTLCTISNFHCNYKDHPHHDGRLPVTTAAEVALTFSHAV